MGDGGLIEAGTHDELLRDEDGAYAKLVNAQKLKEQQGEIAVVNESDVPEEDIKIEEIEKEKAESIRSDSKSQGLERVSTSRSLASEVLSRRNQARKGTDEDTHYGLVYLFKRMGAINKEGANVYIVGSLAAIGVFCSLLAICCFGRYDELVL